MPVSRRTGSTTEQEAESWAAITMSSIPTAISWSRSPYGSTISIRPFATGRPKLVNDKDGKDRLLVEEQVLGSQQGMGGIGGVGARQGVVSAETMSYEEGRAGGFDPHKRIPDMDLDGIDAAFLYPSMGLFAGAVHDPELAAALCRAYNRWLADYCKPYPDRLFGIAMLPMQSIDHAIAEDAFRPPRARLPRRLLSGPIRITTGCCTTRPSDLFRSEDLEADRLKGADFRQARFGGGRGRPRHPGECRPCACTFRRGHRRDDCIGRPRPGAQPELRALAGMSAAPSDYGRVNPTSRSSMAKHRCASARAPASAQCSSG